MMLPRLQYYRTAGQRLDRNCISVGWKQRENGGVCKDSSPKQVDFNVHFNLKVLDEPEAVSTLNGSIYLWICEKTGKRSLQRGIEKTADWKESNGNGFYTVDILMWNRSILQIKWSTASWWLHRGNTWVLPQASLLCIFWCILAYHETMMDRGSRAQRQRTWSHRSPPTGTFSQLKESPAAGTWTQQGVWWRHRGQS